jgi:hypothetical protein
MEMSSSYPLNSRITVLAQGHSEGGLRTFISNSQPFLQSQCFSRINLQYQWTKNFVEEMCIIWSIHIIRFFGTRVKPEIKLTKMDDHNPYRFQQLYCETKLSSINIFLITHSTVECVVAKNIWSSVLKDACQLLCEKYLNVDRTDFDVQAM